MNKDNVDKIIESMVSSDVECNGWCTPLYIYIFLAVIQVGLIMTMKVYHPYHKRYVNAPGSIKTRYAMLTIIWTIFISLIMYYLCKYCHPGWAWFILLLPILLNIIMILGIILTNCFFK